MIIIFSLGFVILNCLYSGVEKLGRRIDCRGEKNLEEAFSEQNKNDF